MEGKAIQGSLMHVATKILLFIWKSRLTLKKKSSFLFQLSLIVQLRVFVSCLWYFNTNVSLIVSQRKVHFLDFIVLLSWFFYTQIYSNFFFLFFTGQKRSWPSEWARTTQAYTPYLLVCNKIKFQLEMHIKTWPGLKILCCIYLPLVQSAKCNSKFKVQFR